MSHIKLPHLWLAVFVPLCLLLTTEAKAQWSADPAINNAICTDYYNQNQIQMIPDGSGGAIVAWVDYRSQPSYSIYAQRISTDGITQWAANGIQVSSSAVNNLRPSLATDGRGGAIITWVTSGDFGNLYAQRVSANGTLQWTSNGVPICATSVSNQAIPVVASDGSGGGIIAWSDSRNNVNVHDDDVYVQRIDSAGVVLWSANGMAVTDTSGTQGPSLQIASDGNGGAILVWEDTRTFTTVEIYTQKIDLTGAILWERNGVQVNSVIGGSLSPQLVSDSGGAIISWVDRRNGLSDMNIFAQKVSSVGTVQWASNGVGVCTTSGNQNGPQLTTDGGGGAIITWNELGFGLPDANVYAQRLNAGGTALWSTNGVGICLASGQQGLSQIAADGNGGAYVTWQDARANNIQDIYEQRIDSAGASMWAADGVAVSTATFVQNYPLLINDGNNGTIVAWTDFRSDLSGQRNDIYVQRVNANGALSGATGIDDHIAIPRFFALKQNYPNPFNPSTTIEYSLDRKAQVTLTIYNMLGQVIRKLVDEPKSAGDYRIIWDGRSAAGKTVSSGVYYYRLEVDGHVGSKMMTLLK